MELIRIDPYLRQAHHLLTEKDNCFCFGDYEAGKGFAHSPINSLIFNYKMMPSVQSENPHRWRTYKLGAIREVARNLNNIPMHEHYTWIPIPPSKTTDHPD